MAVQTGDRSIALVAAAIVCAALLTGPAAAQHRGLASARQPSSDRPAVTRRAVQGSAELPGKLPSELSTELPAKLRGEPVDLLVRDYQALRWLGNLSLSRAQIHTAARWLRGVSEDRAASVKLIQTARTEVLLLEQERDRLAAHRPLPGTLMDNIQMKQTEQMFWQSRAEHHLESAAQSLFYTLSDNQRAMLVGGPASPPPDTARAAVMLERAVAADPQRYISYRKRIEERFPADAGPVAASLDAARSMKPAEFQKWLPSLAQQLASVIDPAHPAGSVGDYQVASQLVSLLQLPAIQAVIVAADASSDAAVSPQADASPAAAVSNGSRRPGGTTRDTTAPGFSILPGTSAFLTLQRQEAVLQQQIEAVEVLSVYGFTPDDIVGGLDEMQKADELRQAYERHDRKVEALRAAAIALTRHLENGRESAATRITTAGSTAPGAAADAAVVQSRRANQQDILADLQLSAMAMLTAMPQAQLDAVAADTSLPYRYVRALQVLQAVRNQSLPQYLSSEKNDIGQAESVAEVGKSADDADRVRNILREARMMSDSAFGAGAAELARRLSTLAHPLPAAAAPVKPAAPVKSDPVKTAPAAPAATVPARGKPGASVKAASPAAPNGTGAVAAADPLSPQSEKEQLVLNATARRLASFLDVPDLWKVLWHALPRR